MTLIRYVCCLLLGFCVITLGGQLGVAGEGTLEVIMLDPSVMPYPLDSEIFGFQDVYIHGIALRNNSDEAIAVERVECGVTQDGQLRKIVLFEGEGLNTKLSETAQRFSVPEDADERADIVGNIKLKIEFGRSRSFVNNGVLASNRELAKGEMGILNDMYFRCVGYKPNSVVVNVTLSDGSVIREEYPVEEYTVKNTYVLPVKYPRLFAAENAAYGLSHHRVTVSEEFAIDFLGFDDKNRLAFPYETNNTSFAGYGADIIAAADGKVVFAGDGLPDNPVAGVMPSSDEIISMIGKYPVLQALGGNCVVIEHKGGEYSFYAHLIPGSVVVKEGDSVLVGQKLGEMGNSGNSDAPHLHFHVMRLDGVEINDSSDYLAGRSIPVIFSDQKDMLTVSSIPNNAFYLMNPASVILRTTE